MLVYNKKQKIVQKQQNRVYLIWYYANTKGEKMYGLF